ncbi:restriction endonuclease subunit S [Nonomuraea basaltis]|uniref:restriction endonuclease subunit S n=1 Tax=Nonomuraea basaltis TaxID=2495887 RepID=UPI00110C5B5E|nr:restriction endonuclease subunit S [Nonomuraea basaltis]TMR94754.1 hypothetical protein EJK15_32070 [Nonomuraea basaltis]
MPTNSALLLPPDWRYVPLGDVCNLVSRGKAPNYVGESPVHAIGQRCVREQGFDASQTRPHDASLTRGHLRPLPGDVLLNSTGTGTIGRSCIFDIDDKFIVDSHVTIIRPKRNMASGKWIQAVLASPAGQNFLETHCYSGSTNQVELMTSRLKTMRIALPPLPDQQQATEILDALDKQIAWCREDIKKRQVIEQGIIEHLLTEVVQSDTGVQWDRLDAIARVDRGKFIYRPRNDSRFFGGTFPFIQTGDVTAAAGGIIENYSQTLNELGFKGSREFPAGSIAVTIAANIGETGILGRPMCFPDSIVGVVVHKPHSNRYVELCLRRAKRQFRAHAPQSAQANINLEDLRPFRIPLPPPEEQRKIARIYESHMELITRECHKVDKLQQIRQGLIDDLLSGKVRLKLV